MAQLCKSPQNKVKELLEDEKVHLVDVIQLEDAQLEVKNIKRDADGFTAIGIKEALNMWHQWHVPNEDLLTNISKLVGREDVYISINSMLSPLRQLKNLRHLHSFWVDLDYYKIKKYKNKTTEEIIKILRNNGEFQDIEPSFFMDSGNGLYIFYLIESSTIGGLPIWQKIQNAFHEKFKKYGADPQSIDAVHVLRLAGTRNTKTNRISRFVFNSDNEYRYEMLNTPLNIYTIKDISEIMLPSLPHTKEEWKKIKESKRQTKKVLGCKKELALYNLHTLHYSRLKDIEILQDLRNGECGGFREIMCFLFRYYSCLFIKNEESALANLLEFNSNFNEPLSKEEVLKATFSAEKAYNLWEDTLTQYLLLKDKPPMSTFFRQNGCYIYSNKRLIKLLNITDEEMEKLTTIISIKEKNRRSKEYRNEWKKEDSKIKRRNECGLTFRQQSKLDNLVKILELKEKGEKQKEISKRLNITQQAVSKLLNEYKNMTLDPKIINALENIQNQGENNKNIYKAPEKGDKIIDINSIDDLINFA